MALVFIDFVNANLKPFSIVLILLETIIDNE